MVSKPGFLHHLRLYPLAVSCASSGWANLKWSITCALLLDFFPGLAAILAGSVSPPICSCSTGLNALPVLQAKPQVACTSSLTAFTTGPS